MKHFALFLAASLSCGPAADGGRPEIPADPATASVPEATPELTPEPADGGPEASHPTASILERYEFSRHARRIELPGRLDEVSGLAMTADGRLFGHDDERGRVHEIDLTAGEVGKRFDLGSGDVRDDFEGIAIVGERFFMVSSRGFLYEFREGDDDADMGYRVTDTRLGSDCEVEGLDYDAAKGILVFACKQSSHDRDFLVLYPLPVDPDQDRPPPILVERRRLPQVGLARSFQPSAVAVTSAGTLLLLSATTESIVEIDAEGTVLAGSVLDRDVHPQPEGLAIGPDGTLYIADEKNGPDAAITAYRSRPTPDSESADRTPPPGGGS